MAGIYNDDYSVRITKRQTIFSPRGEMWNADFILVHGRIYNEDDTRYRKFKFIIQIDFELDLWDNYSETEISYGEAEMNLIFGMTSLINSYNDTKNFYEACNDTIESWNRMRKA